MLCRSQKSNVNKDISCSKEAISFIYGGKVTEQKFLRNPGLWMWVCVQISGEKAVADVRHHWSIYFNFWRSGRITGLQRKQTFWDL